MDRVRITDVSPRDGLQNEPGVIPTREKVELVRLLCQTGVDEVEVTSFVSPKWVPQLGDAAEVLRGLIGEGQAGCGERSDGRTAPSGLMRWPMLSVLVPNERGLDALLEAMGRTGVPMIKKVGVFTAASETFNRRNTNASIDESMERFRPVVERARSSGLLVRGYISCVVACPFEGEISGEKVAEVAERLVALGVDELDLGDTIGAGTGSSVTALLAAVRSRLGETWWTADRMTLHLHDTFGRATECVRAALNMGVRSFDGAVSGLGGCPYAGTPGQRAPGNISTQSLVRTVRAEGFGTGVDLDKLEAAGRFASKIVEDARDRAGGGALA